MRAPTQAMAETSITRTEQQIEKDQADTELEIQQAEDRLRIFEARARASENLASIMRGTIDAIRKRQVALTHELDATHRRCYALAVRKNKARPTSTDIDPMEVKYH